jgi:glycosyltransferase involved in cell wall biosynthesis
MTRRNREGKHQRFIPSRAASRLRTFAVCAIEQFMPRTIAYLTSQYGRAGDTFIRAEVEALRNLGFTVHTFSIRAPMGGEFIESNSVRREREATEDILNAGLFRLMCASLWLAISRPLRFARAFGLTFRLASRNLPRALYPFAYLLEASYLSRRLEQKHVKHLHNHLGGNSAAVAMLASALTDIPYSLTIHGPAEFLDPKSIAMDQKVSRAKFTIAISEFCKAQLMKATRKQDWERTHVVRCGIGEAFLSATLTPVPDVPRLVCVARFIELKGHRVLVEAIDRLVKEGLELQLDFVGDGPLGDRIETALRDRNLQSRVRLLGWKSSDEVRQIMESSRALVLPSFDEGLPVVLMEAMALARPVIATRVGAVEELVEDRVHGWLVRSRSVDELVNAMRDALEAPVERLSEMGAAARECVLQLHDAKTEASKLATLIEAQVT